MNDTDPSKPDKTERKPLSMSLHALDALNLFLADVRAGMGPFLGTFLRDAYRWDAGRVGIALAASQIGTVLAQIPAGAVVDRVRWKRSGSWRASRRLPAQLPIPDLRRFRWTGDR